MKQYTRAVVLAVALLLSVLTGFALVACGEDKAPAETMPQTEADTPAVSDSETESLTETEKETSIVTEPETIPETVPETVPETEPETATYTVTVTDPNELPVAGVSLEIVDGDAVLASGNTDESGSFSCVVVVSDTYAVKLNTIPEGYVFENLGISLPFTEGTTAMSLALAFVPEKTPDGTLPFIPDHPETIDSDWKAIWLSQFDLQSIYTNGSKQRDESGFRKLMTTVLDNVVGDGFNTVILQVRPNADSHYPSEYYPPSAYVVGSYANDFTYDPIAIIVEMCRERGLSVHGWINPMRGMTDAQIKQVDDTYLIKQWYNDSTKKGTYIVQNGSNWYLNPAYPEVRKLICDGAAEILEKYDMDGIHMDDYFYPTTDTSFDVKAYNEYRKGGGTLDVLSWRRTNLDALVSELYATVKTHDLRDLFGISPAGNINTVYNSHCADVYNWCKNPGYIDYIMPQVYFGFEHASWDFVKTANLWSDAIKTDYVSLIIGVSFGKALSGEDNYAGSGKYEWSQHKDILKRGLEYSATMDKCVGMTVFCYKYLYNPTTGVIVSETRQEHEAFSETLKTITWHKDEE